MDSLSKGNVIIKYMEDLGNIELSMSTYEMRVEPITIDVSWSKLSQVEGLKYNPPKRRKAVLEPVTVTFDAYDKNGVKYNMTKTFMLESFHGTFEDDQIFRAIEDSFRGTDIFRIDFEHKDFINGTPIWEYYCNKPVWSTKE